VATDATLVVTDVPDPTTSFRPTWTSTTETLLTPTSTTTDLYRDVTDTETQGEAEGEGKAVGEGEPEEEGEPEGEGEPETEVEPEVKAEFEFNLDAFAEPGPEWELAKIVRREAWEFHIYFFGLCFVVLACYSVFSVIRLWTMEHLLSRNYFVILHVLVISVCVLRATYLLVDAYNSLGRFPAVVDYFLYSTVFPCITAMFSILFYALLLATRVRLMSPKIQKLWVLLTIIGLHFSFSLVTDIIVGVFSTGTVLIFVCQAVFIVWGLLMFIGYLVIFRKLYKGAISRQKTLKGGTPDRLHSSNLALSSEKSGKFRYTFGLAVKITFASAFFGVAIVGFELYGMFGVYGVLKAGRKPEPWAWWTYHFIVRSLELLMCATVAHVASQPLKYTARKDRGRMYAYVLPCSVCLCNDRLDQSYGSSTMSMDYVPDTDHLSWLKRMRKGKPGAPGVSYPPHVAEKYSDPDATLLVRKIRQPKPSMLVVEDGFVRIRREDELPPSNHYELDSRSSHSSGLNLAETNIGIIVNQNYAGTMQSEFQGNLRSDHVQSFSFEDYRIPRIEDEQSSLDNAVIGDSADETDVDIVVTDVEDNDDVSEGVPRSPRSVRSGDIFRPLSLIDLAASIESELDRALAGGGQIAAGDLISYNSLPASIEIGSDASLDAVNEPMYERYLEQGYLHGGRYEPSGGNHAADSDSDQSLGSSDGRLLHSPMRRCHSDGTTGSARSRTLDRNRYFSLSSVESLSRHDEPGILEHRPKMK